MGTIAGSETFGIGVAPHVQWIAAKGCRDGSCLDYGLMASAEWVMVCHPCAVCRRAVCANARARSRCRRADAPPVIRPARACRAVAAAAARS